ncbi:hypothetical protein ACFWE3_22280 [Mycobacteriaceae bacterium NPDC060252]
MIAQIRANPKGSAMGTDPTSVPVIKTWFDGTLIPEHEILAWESRRTAKALKRFKASVPGGGLDMARTALWQAKKTAGRGQIEKRLAREIAVSDALTRLVARASGRHRRLSQVEMLVSGRFTASQLPDWYMARNQADDEAVFLSACPDHHLLRPTEGGAGQEVWETTGGAPVASRFFITPGNEDGLVTTADPAYPVQMAGAATLLDGTVIGGIRHEFRDEDHGVRIRLTVEMPWLMGPFGPAAHRWHLAVEFSNWIRDAAASVD